MSSATEGVNVNIVVAGLESGAVQIWSAWDLSPLRKFSESSSPVTCVAIRFGRAVVGLRAAEGGA